MNRAYLSLSFLAFILLIAGCEQSAKRDSTLVAESARVYETALLTQSEAGRPTVALSSDGQISYYAWVEKEGADWNVFVSAWHVDDPAPASKTRVNSIPGNAAVHAQAPPQVGVDAQGRVHVVWINRIDVPERRFPANDLYHAVSTDGGQSFSPEQTINDDAGGVPTGHTFHNLLALPDGAMLVSWIDGRDRVAAPAVADGSSSAGEEGDSHEHSMPNTATESGKQELAHAAMHQGSSSQIRVARIEDGGLKITETAILDTSSCPCCRTSIALGPDGRVYVAWRHEFENGERDVVLAHSDDGGGTFSDWRPILRDHWFIEGCPHSGPVIDVSGDGSVHAAWYTGAEGAVGIQYAVSKNGGMTFERQERLVENVSVAQSAIARKGETGIQLIAEDRSRNGLSIFAVNDGAIELEETIEDAELPSSVSVAGQEAMTWRLGDRLEARRSKNTER